MNEAPYVTIAVLDDNRWDREAIVRDLEGQPDIRVVGEVEESSELLRVVHERRPHVAVVDLRLAGDFRAGLRIVSQLREAQTPPRVIILSRFPSLPRFAAALESGVCGFINKEVPETHRPPLHEIIRIVAAGGSYYDGEMVMELHAQLDIPAERLLDWENGRPPSLSKAEAEVLADLAQGLSAVAIATLRKTSENTIKSQMKTIRDKFGVDRTEDAIPLARWLRLLPKRR